MKVIVSRLEQYPEDEPIEAAVKKAKTALKSQITKQATALGKKSSLVGTEVTL